MGWKKASPRFAEVFPEFSAEVAALLRQVGREELAKQVQDLRLMGKCGCRDESCLTAQVGPIPACKRKVDPEAFDLPAATGMIVLSVIEGEIREIEVLDRPEFGRVLMERFP